ncbi:MAG: hypothetical protein DRQ08_02820 [Candidatus Latescibacterota bacterium]|nr:MAG: hypothetical protein DRQ08_02820 [Candidatus Latescibacterota bacterium]
MLRRFWPLILAFVVIASFLPSLNSPTSVSSRNILDLPILSCWKNFPIIFSEDFLMFTEGQFRPLSYAFLASIGTLVGPERNWFWHLLFISVHWLNAFLIFLLAGRLSGRWWVGALSSLAFALHPVASVVVGDANYFHYTLGLTFFLASLLSYIEGRSILSLATFVLGAFTSKVVFSLPVVIFAYELLYRGSGTRALAKVLPFVAISLAVSPLWWTYKPHPLHYRYIKFPKGAGWYSFFSVVGASGWHIVGLILGWKVPVVLHEVVGKVFSPLAPKFLVWSMADLGLFALASLALRRGWWGGLGMFLAFGAMLPFASSKWNGVINFVDWSYLYFPSAGLALVLGGLAGSLAHSRKVLIALGGLILFYGVKQTMLNDRRRSRPRYWRQVLKLNPESEIASLELGRALLDRGDVEGALKYLFSPPVKRISDSCLEMVRYYARAGEYVGGAVHLRMAGHRMEGLLYQDYETAAADLFYGAGALDYAEEVLGRCIKANPYNLEAMGKLAEVWIAKGYVRAAEKLCARMEHIAPRSARRVRKLLARRKAGYRPVVRPLGPWWLRYVTEGTAEDRMREEIIEAAERLEKDPVVKLQAAIYLAWEGRYDDALSMLDFVTSSLPSFAHGWAVKSWVAMKKGLMMEAEVSGVRALELDPESPTVHIVMGMLRARQGDVDRAIAHYRRALAADENNCLAYNNLGNLLMRKGKLKEAVVNYMKALRINPDFADAHNNLGIALARQGMVDRAKEHFLEALRIRPDYVEAYNNLGLALSEEGRMDEAVECFREALRIRPDYEMAFENLITVLIKLGRFGEAEQELEGRLKLRPEDVRSMISLAWLLSTCPDPKLRDGGRAVELAEEVCFRKGYRDARALDVLAAAYAEEGRFEEAVKVARRAARLAFSSGMGSLAEQISERLKLYMKHRAYHLGR